MSETYQGQDNRIIPFTMVPNAVIEKRLHPYSLALYTVLAWHVNVKKGNSSAWPSLSTLAEEASMSVRSVIQHLKKLADAKIIKIQRRKVKDTDEYTTNHYTLLDVKSTKKKKQEAEKAAPKYKVIGYAPDAQPSESDAQGYARRALRVMHQMHTNNTKYLTRRIILRKRISRKQVPPEAGKAPKPEKPPKRSPANNLGSAGWEELLAAVGEAFNHHGVERTRTANILRGTYTKRREVNLDEAATVDEVKRFGRWWKAKYPDAKDLHDLVKIHGYFMEFREAEAKNKSPQVVVRKDELVPVVEEEISEEELARRRAETAAAVAAVRGAA